MTAYIGKLHGRNVIDPSDGARLLCCWDTCEVYGTELHKVRIFEGVNPQAGNAPIYSWKVFCTERHKMYYVNSVKDLNNLPAGYKLARI